MKTFANFLQKTLTKFVAFSLGMLGVFCFFGFFIESVTPGRASQAGLFLLWTLLCGFASAILFVFAEE